MIEIFLRGDDFFGQKNLPCLFKVDAPGGFFLKGPVVDLVYNIVFAKDEFIEIKTFKTVINVI